MKRFLLLITLLTLSVSLLNAAAPTTQASNVQINYKTTTGATITWTRGNGSKCIVVVRKNTSTNATPPASTPANYVESATYGNGASLGSGDNFVVYDGTGTSVFVSGLTSNTYYRAYVYEYNTGSVLTMTYYYYNTGTSANANFNTLEDSPTTAATVSSVTPNYQSAVIAVTAGVGGNGRIIYVRPSTGSNSYPIDGNTYTSSSVYGSGAALGGGYVVYNSTGTSVNVTNLLPATLYYASAHEFSTGTYPTSSLYSHNSRNYYWGAYTSFYTLNYAPTINTIADLTICQNANMQIVSFYGITNGSALENQSLSVVATSSNTGLIQNPTVSYASPNTSGILTFTPTAGQSGTATITVTVNDGWFTNNTKSVSFVVTVKAIPETAGVISGASPICAGGTSQQYSIAALANTTGYTWAVPTGWTISNGANSNIITISTVTSAVSGSISVYGTNANGCGNGIASSQSVQVDAQPAAAVAGADQSNLCTGNVALTATAVTTPNTGVWTQLSGPTTVTVPTGNNVSISGMVTPTSTYAFVWAVTNGGVCPAKKDTLTVGVNTNAGACTPSAGFLVNPSTYACAGSVVNLTDNSVSANTWTWSSSPSVGVNFSSTTTANPTVTFATAGTYTVSLQIHSNATGLNYNTNKAVVVKTTPATPGTIAGLASSCANNPNQVSYSITAVTDADGYNWTAPSGANISTNTGNGITILYGPSATDGNVSVTASNTCGTSSAATLAINVNELPVAAGAVSGPATVCQGQNNVTYTLPTINYASNYVWTDILGNTSTTAVPTITYNFATNANNGTIRVKGTNTCGTGDSSSKAITVNPLPDNPGFITGTTLLTTCPVSDTISYHVAAINNATGYVWTVSNGGVITSGANTANIVVDFSSASGAGTIQVKGSNACGNGQLSAALNVNFAPFPTADLCIVTVDTSSLHNEIYWTHPQTTAIDSFKIYRKLTSLTDTLVGTVAFTDPGYLKDMLAIDNPNTNPFEYAISALDTCGNEGAKSAYHKTMFLTVSNGTGVMNLSWNLYVGQTVDFYRILRDSAGTGNWELLNGQVPPSTNVYVDNNLPQIVSNIRYKVDVAWVTSCDPNRGAINTSRSNIKTSSFTVGVNDNNMQASDVSVFPNPSHGQLMIELKAAAKNTIINISNELGQTVYAQKTNTNNTILNTENFAKGMYFITIINEKGKVVKKLMVD